MTLSIKIILLPIILFFIFGEESMGQSIPRLHISDKDIEAVLSDRRYLQRQIQCILGEAPCDPVGRRFKSLAPSVLGRPCPQCTKDEIRQIKKVLSRVQEISSREDWAKFIKKYTGRRTRNA